MKLTILILTFSISFLNCLKAKKSPFDISSPSGLINIGLINFLNGGQSQSSANTSETNTNCSTANTSCNSSSVTVSIAPLYPNNGKGWTYYVKNDGTDRYQATDTACVSTVTGGYNACLHGGEMRKLDLSTKTSCTNLTATDNLSAFNWICRTTSSGVQFVSTGLKKGKGLSDLIDWSAANPNFLPMSLTVKENSTTLLQTTNATWWDNPISVVSPTAVNTTLTTSGTIYVLNSSTPISEVGNIPQVIFNASNMVFLIKPGIRMTAMAPSCVANKFMIDLFNSNFSWVEGDVDATIHQAGLNIRNTTSFAVIRNFKIQNTAMDGTCTPATTFPAIHVQGFNNYITNISIANSNPTGFLINGGNAKENLVYDVTVFNSQNTSLGIGFRIDGGATKNFISGVLVSNNTADGLSILNSSHNNFLFNVTSTNNLGTGEKLASSNLLLSNAMNLNNTGDHLQMNGAPNMTLQNYVSGTSGANHVNLSGGNTDTFFTGVFKVNSVACITAGGSTGGITSTCNGATTGTRSADINYPSTNSYLNFSATPLTLIVIGQTSSDTANSYYSTGTNTYSLTSSWNSFQNFYRGIGKSGTFPTSAIRGSCSSANCQVYDWTLRNSDTIGLNTLPCPGNTSQLPATTITHPLNGGGSVTFLRNTVEIIGDGIGNENGFCESNEACIFTPNIGAYQGHGNLVSASTTVANTPTCSDIGTGGSITNVTLYKYENNGY